MALAFLRTIVVTLALSSSAFAVQTCVSASVPLTTVNWSQPISIPRFNSALGTLAGVRIQLGAHHEGSVSVESLDTAGYPVTIQFSSTVTLSRPDTSAIVIAIPVQNLSATFSAYDGTFDFGGTSGVTFTGLSVDVIPPPVVMLTSAADRALFSGPASNPGALVLNVSAAGTSIAFGAGGLITLFVSKVSSNVTVCYDYAPAVTSYCIGTNAACPCSNGGFLGHGCRNSVPGNGGYLSSSGLAALSADTFKLTASTLPASAGTLFFQGTSRVNGGSGAIFGDGLLCAAGSVTRFPLQTASSGSASYPTLGAPPLSLAGGVSAGDVRTYQAWYRDAAVYCTSDTFNLTQGLEVIWGQ